MRIAVIGAGMTGLTTARALAGEGLEVTVFEKGKGLGGRLASRRGEGVRFDHGALSLTTTEQSFWDALHAHGPVGYWPSGSKAVIGVPGMNDLVKPLADGLDVRLNTRVGGLKRDGDWELTDEAGGSLGRFDVVVTAIPSPQARELVEADQALCAALDRAEMDPQWALMIGWREPLGYDFEVAKFDGAIRAVSRMATKKGREAEMDCWVVHATPEWTRDNLEADKSDIPGLLLPELEAALGRKLPEPDHLDAHRWRYARTKTPLGEPFLRDATGTLYLGGDWALGGNTEHAFLSGRAIAKAVLEDVRVAV